MPDTPPRLKQSSTTKTSTFMPFLFNEPLWSQLTVVCTALLGLVGLWSWNLTKREGAAKDAELARYKEESGVKIAASNARAEEAKKQAEDARREAAEAVLKTEQLKAANLELEISLSPRFMNQTALANALIAYAGTEYSLESFEDPECREFAGQLRFACTLLAKWKEVSPAPNNLPFFFPGVSVRGNWAGLRDAAGEQSKATAEALIKTLNSLGIAAQFGPPDSNMAKTIIAVRVGRRINPALDRQIKEGAEQGPMVK